MYSNDLFAVFGKFVSRAILARLILTMLLPSPSRLFIWMYMLFHAVVETSILSRGSSRPGKRQGRQPPNGLRRLNSGVAVVVHRKLPIIDL